LLYLVVGASALTLFLWNYAPRCVEASAAAIYVNLIPVVGLFSRSAKQPACYRSWVGSSPLGVCC
jgi:drug/metabolite transporter (DMT)-like permease